MSRGRRGKTMKKVWLRRVFGRSVEYSALPGVFLTLLSLLAIYFFRRTAQPSKKFSQD